MATAPLPPVAPAPAPESVPLSQTARIVDSFIGPSKTFTDLRRSAAWWAPFLLLVIASTLFAYTVGQKVGYDKAGENVLQTRPKQWDRIQNMKPEDRAKTMQAVEKQTMIGTYSFPAIDLIILLVVAGLLLA